MSCKVITGRFRPLDPPPPLLPKHSNAIVSSLKAGLKHRVEMLVKYLGPDETASILKLELEEIKRTAR